MRNSNKLKQNMFIRIALLKNRKISNDISNKDKYIVFFTRIRKGLICARYFCNNQEQYRVYIGKTIERVVSVDNKNNIYNELDVNKFNFSTLSVCKFFCPVPKHCKDTILQYFTFLNKKNTDDVMCSDPQKNDYMIGFIRNPILERLFKLGFNCLIEQITYQASKQHKNIEDIIPQFLGPVHKSETDICKYLGINKQQLQFIQELNCKQIEPYNSCYFLSYLKEIYNTDDLSKIEEFVLFDFYFQELSSVESILKFVNITKLYFNYFSKKVFFDCAPALVGVCKTANSYLEHIDLINDIKNLKLDWLVPNSSTCLSDLKDTVKYLNEPKEFFGKKIFKKYKERNKVLQKYLYSNEYFSIVIPESPIDMIKESFVLRNCLREYVRDHANGKTNILFLRRNKSLDESFYAIQLSNKGKIKQVHGKSNCNAKDTPHVKKFIKEWARVKKLHGKDYDDLY